MGAVGGVDVEAHGRAQPAVADDDPLQTEHHHRRQHLQPRLGELAPGGGNELVVDRRLVERGDGIGQAELALDRGERRSVSGGAGVGRGDGGLVARGVDRHQAGERLHQPVAGVVVGDVLAGELLDGLRDLLHQIHERLHLLDRAADDGVKRAVDQVGDEGREGDGAQRRLGDVGDPAGGRGLQVGLRRGGASDRLPLGIGAIGDLLADQRRLAQPLGLGPGVAGEFGGVGRDVREVAAQRLLLLRGQRVERGRPGEECVDLACDQADGLGLRPHAPRIGPPVVGSGKGVRQRHCSRPCAWPESAIPEASSHSSAQPDSPGSSTIAWIRPCASAFWIAARWTAIHERSRRPV